MKKLLLASTALMAASAAAAQETGVTISGYGRFGLVHYSGNVAPSNDTQVTTRLRFNIDAKTETDSGVVFGGRIRLQHSNGDSVLTGGVDTDLDGQIDTGTFSTAARLSPAMLYVSFEGLRVEVGNANTAFDSAALLYDSELGLTDSSFGDARSSFYSFSTGPYDQNRMGVYVAYDINGFSAKASIITADQTGVTAVEEETSVALSYDNDMFTVSAAAAQNGAGILNNDIWFIGAAYKGLPNTTIGLNFIDEGLAAQGSTTVLYANYAMGNGVTLKGYVANNDATANLTDTAFGIGADYDLGGAKLAGGIHRDYAEETFADFGVRFDF